MNQIPLSPPKFIIGAMVGSSLDGVDATLMSESSDFATATHIHQPICSTLKKNIQVLRLSKTIHPDELHTYDQQLGEVIAKACLSAIESSGVLKENIYAIAYHGATLFHQPKHPYGYSWQIGNPHIIGLMTDLPVINDFRNKDILLGGQGAPLAPLFHHAFFSHPIKTRALINIGGISNISILSPKKNPSGFDCGPGNTLLDDAMRTHFNEDYDHQGATASQGKVHSKLLNICLKHPFIKQSPPKSTSQSDFNLGWFQKEMKALKLQLCAHDQLCTLTEFTAYCISQSVSTANTPIDEIIICGGGAHNLFLMERIQAHLPNHLIQTTQAFGLHPDYVESTGFAWLGLQHHHNKALHGLSNCKKKFIYGSLHP